jgi:hypothetical protein
MRRCIPRRCPRGALPRRGGGGAHDPDHWGEAGARLRGFVRERGLPPDGVVLVSATALERDWCGAAGLAGNLSAETFFAAPG